NESAIIEADRSRVLAVDENGYDHGGLRLSAGDAHAMGVVRLFPADIHAAAGLQLRAEAVGLALVPGHARRVATLARHALRHPLALDDEPALAVGANLRQGE